MKDAEIIKKLKDNFAKGRGVRLGEATVISPNVHGNDEQKPGIIKIFTDLDAGQVYMKSEKPGRYLHMDVFHEPGKFKPDFVALRIWEKLREYLGEYQEQIGKALSREEWNKLAVNLGKQIHVITAYGEGTLYDLASHRATPPSTKINGHIHFMIDLPESLYGLLVALANGTEKAMLRQGLEIRKVEGITHCTRAEEDINKQSSGPGLSLQMPNWLAKLLKKNKQAGNVLNLANQMGSLREAKDLLEQLTPAKSLFLGKLARKHDDLPEIIQELADKNLVKKGKLFTTLTEEGRELKELLNSREKEMAALLRKAIRKRPSYTHHTRRSTGWKAKKEMSINKRKVILPPNESYLKHIALSETVINSVTRRFIRSGRIDIQPEDLRVYSRKYNIPVDTCLLLDISGSMVGEKLRAVRNLAENLLLSTRDKVAVVTFQEMEGRVAVPFTNKYQQLLDGLYSIVPGGLTPMADGIMKSLELIRNSKTKNPLLVLITDGIPNYPLWGYDGVEDAFKAAGYIARQKIRFLCIGVTPNKRFMESLAEKGNGHLHLMEDLYRQDLVEVVHRERQAYRATAY